MGLQWTSRVRHNTEQNSLLLAVRKGSSSSAVAHDFCVLGPGGSPCPPVTQAGSAGAVPAQNVPLAQGWCAVLLLCLGSASLPLFQHKEEESSEPGQLSESLSKPCYARTLGKEAVCQTYGWNMLCSSHPQLAYGLPSTAASWALIYAGPENQGPLQSPWWSLLLCFTDFRYAVSQSFPFSLSGILSDRHRGISFTWLKKQSWVFCESKISASWLCRIFYIHGVTADVMQVCKVNKTSVPKATDTETALPSSRN